MAANACSACGCSLEQCECLERGIKKRFVVRRNCEYSTTVEATTQEEAIKIASEDPYTNWDKAWSEIEAEEE